MIVVLVWRMTVQRISTDSNDPPSQQSDGGNAAVLHTNNMDGKGNMRLGEEHTHHPQARDEVCLLGYDN